MSRSRNIKPGFFKNDTLAECSPLARILFCGLWCEADREGRLEDRAKRIKAECLPYDDCDVDDLLQQLAERGFIDRYTVDGCAYIQVVEFRKHQNPHVKEAASIIPSRDAQPVDSTQEQELPGQEPDKHGASTVQDTTQTGTSPADSLILIPDSINSKSERARASASTPEDSQLPASVDPERWASYRDQLADDGKLSISRIKTALMQLRAVSRAGHDPNAVLTAAVMRGLRDLDDCAMRLAREKGTPTARAGPNSAAPMSKTLQTLHALEAAKNDTGLDYTSGQQRLAKADPA